MKKYIHILTALTLLAASCAKSEVNYEPSGQVTLAPVKGTLTKAGNEGGQTLATTQKLRIWAYWDYTRNWYFQDALFAYNSTYGAWAGEEGSYPWPLNGELSFAGYTHPTTSSYIPGYNRPDDTFTFTEYINNEFDFCWFGLTEGCNNKVDGAAVEVTLNHALTWITIKAYGEGTPVGRWQITSLELVNAIKEGGASCYGSTGKAEWHAYVDANGNELGRGNVTLPIIQAQGTHTITDTAAKLTDNIIIPQTPTDLTIGYSYQVGDQIKTDSRTVSLKLDDGNAAKWESGVHYTYTLVFKSNDIQVAPSFGTWGTENQNVTVE
jgi:hypothetical protein